MPQEPAPAHPAATVVLIRDRPSGCEVLLVRRSAQLSFHGGAWVFPGGRLDPDDWIPGDDVLAAARRAAVREAREEAGLVLAPGDLVAISRWVTPVQLPKRFDTWFFAATGTDAPVAVDGGEIHDHAWMAPTEALAAQRAGEIELPPPTFVTITAIAAHRTAQSALAALGRGPLEVFEPRLFPIEGGAVTLYAGDAGYDDAELERPGSRHRLWMREDGWRYERA
ncbi:NUDIX domain-containing protein [bacterium]|nr:NUDIX domain-containing protein [bacterium]